MAKINKTDRTVTVRMSEVDIAELDKFADGFGISRASAMRLLIKQNVKRYNHETLNPTAHQ